MTGTTRSLAPLSHPNFRWYFAASTVNMVGNTMAGVALAFAVLSIDSSPSALGYVLAASTVPLILFLLFGGVIADRLPLTVVLRVGMFLLGASQLAAAAIVISGVAHIWMLIVLEAVNGTIMAMTFPALTSMMPQLVPTGLLQQANALQSFSRGGLRILGPTVSALLVVGVGPGWALGVDAATWLLAAAILGMVKLPPRRVRTKRSSTLEDLHEGWAYFSTTTWLWVVVLGFGFLNAIQAGSWFTLGPAQAKATIGAQGWGYVLSAESVGLILTALVMLRRPLRRPLRSGMLGICLLGLPIFILGWSPNVVALVVCTFIAGAGTEVFSMGWNLAMQEHVPEAMLSRAYSYDALGSFVAMPIGQLTFGPLGAVYGVSHVLMISGAAYLAISMMVLASGSVRGLRRVVVTSPDDLPVTAP